MFQKGRLSKFELLRMLAMFMILLSHYCVHGVRAVTNYNIDLLHESFYYLCSSFGEIAVGIFFMLSGYLLYAKSPNFRRARNLLGQIYFYSILFLLVWGGYRFLGKNQSVINAEYFINCLFPIGRSTWWFISVYILLYVACDSFRCIFDEMGKNIFIKVILFFWLFFFFVPAFVGEPFRSLQRGIFFFLCGRYCRIYKPMKDKSKIVLFIAVIFFLICTVFIDFASVYVSSQFNISEPVMKRFSSGVRSGFFIPFCAILIFIIFEDIDIGSIKWINTLSAGTFGVYLIHDSPLRMLIWKVFRIKFAWETPFFALFAFFSCSLLFVLCIAIDLLRRKLFKFFLK